MPPATTVSSDSSPSCRTMWQHLNDLKKENFSLKLRIYFLEEKIQQKFEESGGDGVHRTNIELKVQVESLKKELEEKQQLLDGALSATELLTTQSEAELQRRLQERQEDISHMQEVLEAKVQLLQEEAELARGDAQRLALLADSEAQRRQALEQEIEGYGRRPPQVANDKDKAIEELTQQKHSLVIQVEALQAKLHQLDPSEAEAEMEKSGVQVSAESLQLIVAKHFQHISTAQWSTLALGGRDLQVEQTISDMLVEMVESSTVAILREVTTPRKPEQECWDKISVDLGDSINVGFAAALQLPAEKNKAVEKLTELVEVVSVQLRSLLASSSTSQPWPLDKMVNFTTSCLKKYLEKVQCLTLGLHTSLPSAPSSLKLEEVAAVARCGSQEADRAKISAATVVKAVNWILEKGLSKTIELEGGRRDAEDLMDLEELSSNATRSLQPSRAVPASPTDDCAYCLSCKRSTKDQLETLCPGQEHQGRVESESRSPELDEQASAPPTTTPSPSPSHHQGLSAWSSEDQGSEDSPSATYEEMTDSDLDLLFERLNRPPYFGPAGDETLNHMIGCEARSFAVKLTDKISFYLGYPGLGSPGSPGSLAESPPGSPPGARSLSDSLLYDLRQRRRWCQRHHHHHEGAPPELLWALTEDEVRRFLLKVLLWVEKSSRVGGGYVDEASVGVTNDDDDDDDDGDDDVDEVVAVTAQPEEDQDNLSVRTRSLGDSSLEEELEVEEEEDSPNDHLELCTSSSSSAASSTSSSSPNQEIQPPSPEIRRTIWHLLQALLVQLSSKTQSKRSKDPLELPPPLPPPHLDIVLGRLSERVLSEVTVPDSAVEKIHRCTKTLVRALAKDLVKEFEGKQEVLKALASACEDLTFENAVMFHLTGCLHSLLTTPPKRSAVSRMLSVVKKLGNRT